jgi:SHS family lactate transporter-like MFS transporter
VLQGLFGQAIYGQNPAYLPTEVRATASAFCYRQGAIFGGFVPLVLTWFASHYGLGFAIPMLIGTCVGAASFGIALLLGPGTKRRILVPDLILA